MNSSAIINVWGNIAAYIVWDEKRNMGVFEYEPEFLQKALDLSPLHMPVSQAFNQTLPYSFPYLDKKVFSGLPGLLSDSLPDLFGNKVIDQWQKYSSRNIRSLNPIERLCFMGKRAMGALEFKPVLDGKYKISDEIQLDEIANIAQQISNNEEFKLQNINEHNALHHIFQVGASAGGKRPKAIIGWNKNTGAICSGQDKIPDGFEHWLLKLDSDSQYPHGRVEYAYALMAKECGINMTDVDLIEQNNKAYFLTKRFDRIGNTKMHTQTLCGLAHYSYIDTGAYGYEDAFAVFRKLNLPYYDIEKLYRLMCFNFFAKNYDDHTKNISFIMDNMGKWQFAPAYDLTFCHLPDEPSWFHKHEMHINGKTNKILVDDLVDIGSKNDIRNTKTIIQQCQSVVLNWSYYANKAAVPKTIQNMINTIIKNT